MNLRRQRIHQREKTGQTMIRILTFQKRFRVGVVIVCVTDDNDDVCQVCQVVVLVSRWSTKKSVVKWKKITQNLRAIKMSSQEY